MPRRDSPIARVLVTLACALLGTAAAGCGLMGQGQGDPAAPVLIQGRVVDGTGRGVGGADIQLAVNDFGAATEVGQRVPVVYSGSFSAGPDGWFALHLAPTLEIVALAQRNGGFVNFQLMVQAGGGIRPWGFPRELKAGTWVGSIPSIVIAPDGVTEPGVDQGVPVPLPAET